MMTETEKENNQKAVELFEYTKSILDQLKKEFKIKRSDKIYKMIINQMDDKLSSIGIDHKIISKMINDINKEATAINSRTLVLYYHRIGKYSK